MNQKLQQEQKQDELTAQQKQKLKEIQQIGQQTIENAENINLDLYQQNEQLERIHDKGIEIENTLHKTNFLIKGIKSTWGSIKNIFRKPKKSKEQKACGDSKLKFKQEQQSELNNSPSENLQNMNINHNQKQSEFEENLDQILNQTNQIKLHAQNMGKQINYSNQLADKIKDQTDKNNKEMTKQNKEMRKFIKN